MPHIRRIMTWLMWPMVFLLPLWITLGKGLLGSNGWGSILLFFYVAPVLIVALIAINLLIHFSSIFKREHLVTKSQAVVMASLYCCVFLYGIFFVDGVDTQESVGSVATRILGRGFENISGQLGNVFFIASIVLLVVTGIVVLGGGWVRSLRAWLWLTVGVLLLIEICAIAGLHVW